MLKKVVISIAGPMADKLVDLLYGKDNINEFDIAKKLGVTINQARNILYKLADEGLVNFTRKKDKKSGGWYTYFWTLDVGKSLASLKNKIDQQIKNIEHQINSKQVKRFYYCKNCDIELSEENALLYDFTCQECGEVFKLKDNVETIENLRKDIKNLQEILKVAEKELMEIGVRHEVSKQRKLKGEERKKKKEREAIRKERIKEKERTEKNKIKIKKAKKKKTRKRKSGR